MNLVFRDIIKFLIVINLIKSFISINKNVSEECKWEDKYKERQVNLSIKSNIILQI